VIIGEVELTTMRRIVTATYPGNTDEVAPSQLSATERACGDYTPGRWAWSLAQNLQLNKFLPCRGALSVWEVPSELVRQFDYLPF
jgi:hypothetical protein